MLISTFINISYYLKGFVYNKYLFPNKRKNSLNAFTNNYYISK